MKAPIASRAGFLPATGGRSFGATTPGDDGFRAAAGVLSARLRSSEHGLESREDLRLHLRKLSVKGSRLGRPGQGRHRAGRSQSQGRLQGLTGGLCKEPIIPFRLQFPKIPAIVRNAPRLGDMRNA